MPIALPYITTDAGDVARTIIAESRNPGHASYEATEVKNGMYAMKATVDNRLTHSPGQFNAPGAVNYTDIITTSGQWHGFSKGRNGEVVIAADVAGRIDTVLVRANAGAPGPFYRFVEAVLDVTNAPISDPFAGLTSINGQQVTGGAYGWRTAGSSDPGGLFVAIPTANNGVIAGNQFYTLRSDMMNEAVT